MCKSHLMIAIYSEWRPLLFTCLVWARPFVFEKSGRGGGGVSENRKKRKVGEQVRTQGSMGRLYASPTYFWYLYNSHIFSPIRMKMVE